MENGNDELRYSENFQQEEAQKQAKVTVPVVEERVIVGKKVVETARVTLSKKINESVESFEVPLEKEEIIIKRVPKNELVDTIPPASRYEGDVMIIPVLKEVAVVEKRVMLVEEIHVTKLKTEETQTQEVTVRKEEVEVTRTEL